MEGNLCFFYLPVSDIKSVLSFYRDQLGLEEAWREGDSTVSFKLPGTDVQLMLDQDNTNLTDPAGPVFKIASVDEFFASQQEGIQFVREPVDIPGGRWVGAKDTSGNGVYFLDQSKA